MLWALAVLPCIAAGITALNLLTWPRGRLGSHACRAALGRISAVVPARNEESSIAACVRALAGAGVDQIVVWDDASTDRTPRVLDALSLELREGFAGTFTVGRGTSLPPGWVGKAHACERGAALADGDLLLFVDADVRVAPDLLARLSDLHRGVDVVTAVPRQETGTFLEHHVLPLLHLTYLSWLPLALIPRTRDPRILAANGQILSIHRAGWERVGGFAAVRAALVDDMAFCTRAKSVGLRVRFADGFLMARCRMYTGGGEVWRGFSKNLYAGLGATPGTLAGALALYTLTFVLPWLLLPLGAPAWVAVGANLMQRAALVVRYRHRPETIPLHLIGFAPLFGIAWSSWRWHAQRRILWRGRSYPGG